MMAATSPIDFLLEGFAESPSSEFMVHADQSFDYAWLLSSMARWRDSLRLQGIAAGDVVALEGDFSPEIVAGLLCLVESGCIVVPLHDPGPDKREACLDIAQCQWHIAVSPGAEPSMSPRNARPEHELYATVRSRQHPGLVLFSSGTTGAPKAAVHDFVPLLAKFRRRRHCLRTISFLLFDHIGGVNTMLYVLSNQGCIVVPTGRSPVAVLSAIEEHRVQLLPTSPTFLNLLLLGEQPRDFDLSSLELVTYGTESMPERTLERLHELWPEKRLLQTYGLSELGILRSKSRSDDSLWMKVGGEGYETRVVDGMLQIRSESMMLGYLNAPDPRTPDGWYPTGDEVEVDGEYLRILGRRSDIINVGGEKVRPVEVESVIQDVEGVADARVFPRPHPITGQIVCAELVARDPDADCRALRRLVKRECMRRLETYKVPVKLQFATGPLHNPRFKKSRAA